MESIHRRAGLGTPATRSKYRGAQLKRGKVTSRQREQNASLTALLISRRNRTVFQCGTARRESIKCAKRPVHTWEWEQWSEHFAEVDELATQKDSTNRALSRAVSGERYAEATELQEELRELEGADTLHALQQELQAALKDERYEEAASLRDEGCMLLQGWWTGQIEGQSDVHLLRINPAYGRWTGTRYSCRDLAESKGWGKDGTPSPGLAALAGLSVKTPTALCDLGKPVLELFLGRDESENLWKQATYLQPAEYSGTKGDATPSTLEMIDEMGKLDQRLHLERGIKPSSKESVGKSPVKSDFSELELEEALQTLLELKDANQENVTNSSLSSSSSPPLPTSTGGRQRDAGSQGTSDLSWLNELRSKIPRNDVYSFAGKDAGISEIMAASEQQDQRFVRRPAQITASSKDAFTVKIWPIHSQNSHHGDTSRKVARSSSSEPRAALITNSAVESDPTLEAVGRSGNETIKHKEESGTSSKSGIFENASETWQRMSRQIAQMQEAKSNALPQQKLVNAIKGMARSLLGTSTPSPHLTKGPTMTAKARGWNSTTQASRTLSISNDEAVQPTNKLGDGLTITYKRIKKDCCPTDPFQGFYLGAFGSAGPELLQLARTHEEDGSEWVIGTKITGDINVPAGVVSFRAKIERKHRMSLSEGYYETLGVVARYKGQGRVALPGFRNPRWVEGEMLQFSSSGSPITGGAELGFVWAVSGEKRYLILLNKIDLD